MTKRENYESRFEEILRKITDANGLTIYDVEYVKEGGEWYLRGYIDKEGGVTIDDCELVSRAVSDVMDRDDFIEDAYILEISSPGLGRALKKDKHLAGSIGEEVELKTYKPVDGAKEYVGLLKAFDKDTITIELKNNTEKVFRRDTVAQIRLTVDF
ncbi:MAG: ribosome maturation factor RimP [Lachnospiraceae bacterium]